MRASAPRERRPPRAVTFPDDGSLVTGYLDPDNPWAHVEETSGEELILGYVESCRKHGTSPLECVVAQLKDMKMVSGSCRQSTLILAGCILTPIACEALEAILKKVRFQRIDVHNCELNDDAAVALFDMVEYYESASELDISENKGFGIPAWQACSKMVNKSQWLEQLEIRDTSLSESSAPVLGRGLRPACSLRSLHLQRSRLTGAPLLCLAGYLKQNKSVRELHIGDNKLIAADAKHLASMLKSNSFLQLLDVSNNDIQDSGMEAIADALEEQSFAHSSSSSSSSDSPMSSPQSSSSGSVQDRGLAVLIVWNNNLTRNSGKHFSKTLSRCRSLEVLNVGQNPLCGETVNRFKNALQQNRSLLSLGMQSTKLGAEAAIALAEVIEDNPVIQRIDLRDNKLQSAGLLALVAALKKNQTVTRIDLDDAPPVQPDKEQPLEEARLVSEVRSLCKRNENQSNPSSLLTDDDDSTSMQRRRAASFTTRKISLTCQTLHTLPEPVLSPPKTSSGRLRSPSPSPIPSPASSPIPSPSHRSRFQVSRVSDSSSGTSQSPSPSTPPGPRSFFPGNSRFRVVSVQEPPSISVHGPDEIVVRDVSQYSNTAKPATSIPSQVYNEKFVKCPNSRFRITRNVEIPKNETNQNVGNQERPLSNITSSDQSKSISNISGNTVTSEIQTDSQIIKNIIDENLELKTKIEENGNPKKTFNVIKKNKSESSLDSPDLEVSRLMQPQGKKNTYDSSSSLDISGSSMESLNTLELNIDKIKAENVLPVNEQPVVKQMLLVTCSQDSEENDVFADDKIPRKLGNLSSSNESSLDLSAPVEVPQGNIFQFSNSFLNSSVSSNESVSPNIFGKHMKLHGSVTSLEASVSSLDSFKSNCNTLISPSPNDTVPQSYSAPVENCLVDSTDSGIFQSDNSPKTTNDSMSSNEGTLTDNSNLSKLIRSIGSSSLEGSSSKVPERTSSLLDVPSSSTKQRVRKISWVSPSTSSPSKKEIEDPPQQQKPPSSLEKLLNIFQNPVSLFSRSLIDTSEKKTELQNAQRRDSQTSSANTSGSFWLWNLGSANSSTSKSQMKNVESAKSEDDKNINRITSSISAEYTVKLFDRKSSQDDVLTSTTATIINNLNSKSNISDDGKTSEERSSDVVRAEDEKAPDPADDICNLSLECEVLHCDNVDEIDSEDPDIIYSDICDSDVDTCDKNMVQSNVNVTTLSFVEDDNIIISKDSVQNNLLVLSACDIDLGSDESQNKCDLNSETEDCLFSKTSRRVASVTTNDDDIIQVVDLEMDTSEMPNMISNSIPSDGLLENENDELLTHVSLDDDVNSESRIVDLEMSEFKTNASDVKLNNEPLTSIIPHIEERSCTDLQNISDCSFSVKVTDSSFDKNITGDSLDEEQPAMNSDDEFLESLLLSNTKTINAYSDDLNLILKSDRENSSVIVCENVKDIVKGETDKKSPDFTSNTSERILPHTSVLKQSIGLENKTSSDKQLSPESGPSIDNLPSKIIKRIKENISPENTLTSSMSNTQALVQELAERRKVEHEKVNEKQRTSVSLEIKDISNEDVIKIDNQFIIEDKIIDRVSNVSIEEGVDLIEVENKLYSMDQQPRQEIKFLSSENLKNENILNEMVTTGFTLGGSLENVTFEPKITNVETFDEENVQINFDIVPEIKTAKFRESMDFGADPTIEEAKDVLNEITFAEHNPERERPDRTFNTTSALKQNSCVSDDDNDDVKPYVKPVSILKKSYNERKHCSLPRNIPEHNKESCNSVDKHTPIRCGSLPESISGYSPKSDLSSRSKIAKSRSPINTLGKMARDSLYALNMNDDEIAELAQSKRLSSLESVRSLGSVSEDAGDTFPLRKVFSSSESRSLGPCTSQESLASLASISEMAIVEGGGGGGGGSVADMSKHDDKV